MPTDPTQPSRTNINTWLSVAGFALTIFAGSVAIGRFQSETQTAIIEMSRRIQEMKEVQIADKASLDARPWRLRSTSSMSGMPEMTSG